MRLAWQAEGAAGRWREREETLPIEQSLRERRVLNVVTSLLFSLSLSSLFSLTAIASFLPTLSVSFLSRGDLFLRDTAATLVVRLLKPKKKKERLLSPPATMAKATTTAAAVANAAAANPSPPPSADAVLSRDWMFCPVTGALLELDAERGVAWSPVSGFERQLEGTRTAFG